MTKTAFEMQPRHFSLLSELSCKDREEKLKAIIQAYSAYFAACRKAKLDLTKSINIILGLEKEEKVKVDKN